MNTKNFEATITPDLDLIKKIFNHWGVEGLIDVLEEMLQKHQNDTVWEAFKKVTTSYKKGIAEIEGDMDE